MKIKLFTIPNLLTLSNLLCGAGSIVASLVYENFTVAFAFILISAIFDFFDGFAARILKQPSAIGIQLDSLADMVSFGTAPAMILYTLSGLSPRLLHCDYGCYSKILQIVVFIIVAFSALRLAKFNIDETQHDEFCGLTTTANAIFCSSFVFMCTDCGIVVLQEWIAVLSIVVALLLISPIRMFSFKMRTYGWQGNEVRYTFIILSFFSLLLFGLNAIPFIIVAYIVISTLIWIFKMPK